MINPSSTIDSNIEQKQPGLTLFHLSSLLTHGWIILPITAYRMLNLFQSIMIVTKLFESTRKQLGPKPEHVKIKYKTYRQLLGLDRPKKQIYVESDNQNDDFLEKLLKEQEKEKKKKSSLRKSHTSSKKSKRREKGQQPAREPSTQVKKEKTQQLKLESKELSQTKRENRRKVVDVNKSKELKQASPQRAEEPKIKIDDTNEVPYIANNHFENALKTTKSFSGFRKLQKNIRGSESTFKLKHDLNPELHAISHKFSKTTSHSAFKANLLSTEKLLAMSEVRVNGVMQRRVFRRERLFKNEQEEEKFFNCIKSIKTKKFSMPSLL